MSPDEPLTDDDTLEQHSCSASKSDDCPDDTQERLSNPTPLVGEHPGGRHHQDEPFPAIANRVQEYLGQDSTGHGLDHCWRVFRLSHLLSTDITEPVDRLVVGCAALTHDLHRGASYDGDCSPSETIDDVASILRSETVDEEKIQPVLHCVAIHDKYTYRGEDPEPRTIEAALLRDADNLDAMGAIGIGRAFAYGGVHGTPLWDPAGQKYSQLYHFEDKLFQLKDEMHTKPARRLAEDRHEFLLTFHKRFRREWHGEA